MLFIYVEKLGTFAKNQTTFVHTHKDGARITLAATKLHITALLGRDQEKLSAKIDSLLLKYN